MNKPLTIQLSEYIKQLSLTELMWLIEKMMERVRELLSNRPAHTETTLSLDQFVTELQATPPNPANIRQPQGSLADALRSGEDDPEFDLERWTKEWAVVEAEMKLITEANNRSEGVV